MPGIHLAHLMTGRHQPCVSHLHHQMPAIIHRLDLAFMPGAAQPHPITGPDLTTSIVLIHRRGR